MAKQYKTKAPNEELDASGEIRWVELGGIKKPIYQRGSVGSYREIRNSFDPLLYDVIVLSERKDGSLWVVDGLQRVTGRIDLEGPGTLVAARVLHGLTIEDEVRLFEQLNKNRVRVCAYDIVRAKREAGDKVAVKLFTLVTNITRDDVTYLQLGQQHGPTTVGSPQLLLKILSWDDGEHLLIDALNTLTDAWGMNHGTYHSALVSGFATFYRWVAEQHAEVSTSELAARLRTGKYAATAKQVASPLNVPTNLSAKAGAAEQVAGVVACIWDAQRKHNRVMVPAGLETFLKAAGYNPNVLKQQG